MVLDELLILMVVMIKLNLRIGILNLATTFKTQAGTFKVAAAAIPTDSLSGQNVGPAIEKFQAAAAIFGYKQVPQTDISAAKYFKEFATALMGNICQQKLLTTSLNRDYVQQAKNFVTAAKEFKDAAKIFVTKAKEFKDHNGEDEKLVNKFHAVGNTFGTVGEKFQAVGTSFKALGTKLNSRCNELQNKAEAFQGKATKFKEAVDTQDTGFKQLAQAVTASDTKDQADLKQIKVDFKDIYDILQQSFISLP